MKYEIGQRFIFKQGDKVICNGYNGTVIRMYSEGMVEVRLSSGSCCVPSSFPDCYPAPLEMTPTELTQMGFSPAEQVEIYALIATCYDVPADAPRSSWERAARLIARKR